MEKGIKLSLEPSWNITSELPIHCSKCDFAFLVPLVAMVGKKQDTAEFKKTFKETKGSLLSALGHVLPRPKKDSGHRVFGYLWPYSKFCKKCKTVYVAKLHNTSIKLKNKYWEGLRKGLDFDSDFVFYLDEQTRDIDVYKRKKCECGGALVAIRECPVCNSALKISRKEIDGLPIMMANSSKS